MLCDKLQIIYCLKIPIKYAQSGSCSTVNFFNKGQRGLTIKHDNSEIGALIWMFL